jgi:hypothetical protein
MISIFLEKVYLFYSGRRIFAQGETRLIHYVFSPWASLFYIYNQVGAGCKKCI